MKKVFFNYDTNEMVLADENQISIDGFNFSGYAENEDEAKILMKKIFKKSKKRINNFSVKNTGPYLTKWEKDGMKRIYANGFGWVVVWAEKENGKLIVHNFKSHSGLNDLIRDAENFLYNNVSDFDTAFAAL